MKDRNIQTIRTELAQFKPEKIILFGSRAKGTSGRHSDYDVMLIFDRQMDRANRISIASSARKILAQKLIDADILVKTLSEYERLKSQVGTVSRQVFLEGVAI